jgi:hypothetical protein
MFAIVNNNSLIYGPAPYNIAMFRHILVEDLELEESTFTLPPILDGKLTINENTVILPTELHEPEAINTKIEQHAGPFWTFTEEKAIGAFGTAPKNIDQVKNELKAQLAVNRFKLETKSIDIAIQGTTVTLLGTRETKMIVANTYIVMPDESNIDWKFENNIFLNLSKAEMGYVLQQVVISTQSAFSLESAKIAEIDDCETLEELDLIDISLGLTDERFPMM